MGEGGGEPVTKRRGRHPKGSRYTPPKQRVDPTAPEAGSTLAYVPEFVEEAGVDPQTLLDTEVPLGDVLLSCHRCGWWLRLLVYRPQPPCGTCGGDPHEHDPVADCPKCGEEAGCRAKIGPYAVGQPVVPDDERLRCSCGTRRVWDLDGIRTCLRCPTCGARQTLDQGIR